MLCAWTTLKRFSSIQLNMVSNYAWRAWPSLKILWIFLEAMVFAALSAAVAATSEALAASSVGPPDSSNQAMSSYRCTDFIVISSIGDLYQQVDPTPH